MKQTEEEFSIGVLSERSGVNIETIRYYERIGLMPAPPRRGRLERRPHEGIVWRPPWAR